MLRLIAIETGGEGADWAVRLRNQALKGDPDGAIPPLADTLVKSEGGPADTKRAASLLSGGRLRCTRYQSRAGVK